MFRPSRRAGETQNRPPRFCRRKIHSPTAASLTTAWGGGGAQELFTPCAVCRRVAPRPDDACPLPCCVWMNLHRRCIPLPPAAYVVPYVTQIWCRACCFVLNLLILILLLSLFSFSVRHRQGMNSVALFLLRTVGGREDLAFWLLDALATAVIPGHWEQLSHIAAAGAGVVTIRYKQRCERGWIRAASGFLYISTAVP